MKNPQTTWHAIAAIGAFALLFVGAHLLGLSDGAATALAGFVATLLTSLGLIQAGDAATLERQASDAATAINPLVDAVEKLETAHAANAAQIAANKSAIAVHAAQCPVVPTASPLAPLVAVMETVAPEAVAMFEPKTAAIPETPAAHHERPVKS
jgi:hypothetical protein